MRNRRARQTQPTAVGARRTAHRSTARASRCYGRGSECMRCCCLDRVRTHAETLGQGRAAASGTVSTLRARAVLRCAVAGGTWSCRTTAAPSPHARVVGRRRTCVRGRGPCCGMRWGSRDHEHGRYDVRSTTAGVVAVTSHRTAQRSRGAQHAEVTCSPGRECSDGGKPALSADLVCACMHAPGACRVAIMWLACGCTCVGGGEGGVHA